MLFSSLLLSALYLLLRVQGSVEEMLSGSQAARTRLIEHNLRLVAHIVKNY